MATGQKLSHVVFFKLKDSSPANVQVLVDACHKYLKNHPGVNFFAAGTLAKEYARPVNDHDFDVCLNVVFDSREAHDAYQTVADHLTFIAEHKPSWEKVRVFDADVT
ncbi:MAG: Dabb family protein [Planctomycetota bacterium]|nr:Dabb family protein [Planctomycetota bacterium]